MKKLSRDEFILRSNNIHNEYYCYDLVVYSNAHTKVKIICPVHGVYDQIPSDHMRGVGCQKCYYVNNHITTAFFIEKAINIHGSYYIYDQVEYKRFDEQIKIICPIHGEFTQKPYHHLTGRGCRNCFVDRKSFDYEIFLNKCNELHDYKYQYNVTDYKNLHSIIRIICPIHGEFKQKANNHFNGAGCPLCQFSNISKIENIWLDFIGVPFHFRNKVIFINDKRYNLDAYDSDKNIIYEFYGDFWHGNPKIYDANDINTKNKKSFGELHKKTMDREKIIRDNGYQIIFIWENDFRLILRESYEKRIINTVT